MNLAWLAAVLQPRDVTRHPNFTGTDTDTSGVAHLAGLVLGGEWWRVSHDKQVDSEVADDMRIIIDCMGNDTIGEAVPQLASRLRDRPPKDSARGSAFAIFLSAAAAELDDFDIAFQALDAQLARLDREQGADAALVRGALLQQRALRARDAGRPFVGDLREVGRLLKPLDPAACSHFPTSAGVSWTSVQTVKYMRDSLLMAASSLYPSDEQDPEGNLLSRIDLVRQEASAAERRAHSMQANAYADFVEKQYIRETGNTRYVLGPPPNPDTFHALLGLELVGSGLVYSARKELALLRLVQGEGDTREHADAVRLLRHSGAAKDVLRVVDRLRASGPLSALAEDARQILTRRLDVRRLRTIELDVLTAASDVLTKPEARRALLAVETTLDRKDGPIGVVGHWQLPLLRREAGWKAMAALAGPAQEESRVAHRLLWEFNRVDQDMELADRAIRRALLRLDLRNVPLEARGEWMKAVESRVAEFPGVYDAITSVGDNPPESTAEENALDRLASWVNAKIRGQKLDREPPLDEDYVREELKRIRREAAAGHFSMGGADSADIVAALVSLGYGASLWTDLSYFLVDRRVARADRTRAFDRLAREDVVIPQEAVEIFSSSTSEVLLSKSQGFLGQDNVTPYPAALRFFAVHGILDSAASYGFLSQLVGSADLTARREAARTVAVLASRVQRAELLALALPMSHDADVVIRAQASVALAYLSTSGNPLASVAAERIEQLLAEDGIDVPLTVIHALKGSSVPLSAALARRLTALRDSHPSRSVRVAAGDMLE